MTLEEAIAVALRDHFPTTGMQVASGVTCMCGYWTGSEPAGLFGAGSGGRDQLNRHRAKIAAAVATVLLENTVEKLLEEDARGPVVPHPEPCPHRICKFEHDADACGWCTECHPEIPDL